MLEVLLINDVLCRSLMLITESWLRESIYQIHFLLIQTVIKLYDVIGVILLVLVCVLWLTNSILYCRWI